jgi:DNA-binding transcriptional MerR regulator
VSRRPSFVPAEAIPSRRASRSLRPGELARLVGVSTDTLRHYERKGVLPAPHRLANGYRRYPPEALARVRTVRAALAVGFTLDELAALLGARDRGRPPCREVRELAATKMAAAEQRLAELSRLVETLRGLLASWDARLAATMPGAAAHLLETLAAEHGADPPSSSRPRLVPPPTPSRRKS